MTRIIPFLTFFTMTDTTYAQESRNSIEFSPQVNLSIFLEGDEKLSGTTIGGEIIYHINKENSTIPWISSLNISSIDFILNYKSGNDIVINDEIHGKFGDSYALMTGVTVPLARGKNTGLYFSPGIGVAYAGQTWFTNENPLIASHFNFALAAALKARSSIIKNLALTAGVDAFHYSNAAMWVPNRGINSINLNLGILHYLNHNNPPSDAMLEASFESPLEKHTIEAGVNMGRRGINKSKKGLIKTGFYGGYSYRLNPIFGLSTGVDAVYYHTTYDPNRHEETYQSSASSFKRWRAGVAVGPDIWMGRLGLSVKYGQYLYYESLMPINNYWTAGIRYQLTDWAAIQAKTYLHKTQVDFMGFGLVF